MDAAFHVTLAPANPAPCGISGEDASPIPTLLRRFFPIYCVLAAVVTFGYALYDSYQLDGDAVAYMDIGDYLRAHQWAGVVNGYWHPMYPAFLSLGHMLFQATLSTELRAYYFVNFGIFLLEMAAVVWLVDALIALRAASQRVSEPASQRYKHLLDRYAVRYLGLALLVIASQRELSLGKVRPDALLQAFLLFALAALLRHLATGRTRYAALMGVALGCAYLTKSFAFVFALLCIAALAAFRWLWLRHRAAQVIPAAAVAFACFAMVAGPYVTALSRQHGRLDFGDSGALNYAWYVGGTEKMHLQPYMTAEFGTAEVHLKHPERELLHSPQVLSYAEMPYGTYPDWFDATYWNDQVKPHFNLRGEIRRVTRNCELVVRYLLNHPEASVLLALLLALGARARFEWKPERGTGNREPETGNRTFWIAPLLLGVGIWGIYAIVNTEERYVTVAYLTIVLTVFAMLRGPEAARDETQVSGAKAPFGVVANNAGTEVPAYPMRSVGTEVPAYPMRKVGANVPADRMRDVEAAVPAYPLRDVGTGVPAYPLRDVAGVLVVLLALLAVGESLRTVLEDRRNLSVAGYRYGWHSAKTSGVAAALAEMGVQPGDTVACVGEDACLVDPYWARLAGVRVLTEIYDPDVPVYPFLATLSSRDQVVDVVRGQGAKVLVGEFGSARVSDSDPFFREWRQLDDTTMYALPLKDSSQ